MISKHYSNITQNNFLIKKETLEWIVVWSLMFFSFISNITLLISMLLLILFFQQNEIGVIKILNIVTLRTIINPGISVNIGNFQNFKWVIIFICSFYLLLSYRKIDREKKIDLNKVLISILTFTIYSIISSFFFSTLPIVAIFKLMSYIIVFIAIIIGVVNTSQQFNWIKWMYKMLGTLFIISIMVITLPIAYLRNGHAFQGFVNHPNMFGIIGALFIAIIMTRVQLKEYNNLLKVFLEIVTAMYMIFLSKSRTGLIASIILLLILMIFSKINTNKKVIIFSLSSIILGIHLFLVSDLFVFFKEFLYKGNQSILFSRINQVNSLMSNFYRSPFWGSGFAVPVTSYRTYIYSVNYIVEPGNLILAVLSYTGIVGFILFVNYMCIILYINRHRMKNYIFLFLTPILISMGEMVFFSSNNIGIWCYMFYAIYISQNN